jgi:hypothetical protein
MDDLATRPRAKISAAEMERRRTIVRRGDAHNRIEGVFRDPATNELVEAFVRGDIEATDLVPLFKAELGPR